MKKSEEENSAEKKAKSPESQPQLKSETAPSKKSKKSDIGKLWSASPTKVPRRSTGFKEQQEEIQVKEPIGFKRLSIGAMVILVIGLAAHLTGIFGGEVFLDHYHLGPLRAIENTDQYWAELVSSGILHPLSQPWVRASFVMDAQSSGMSMVWLHTVNLFLHLLTALYLFILLFRLGRMWKAEDKIEVDATVMAFAAAGIFVCHPLANQSVSYISSRDAVLIGVNYFLCLNVFLLAFLSRGAGAMLLWYACLLVFGAMAVFSGVAALSLPIVMLAVAASLKPDDMTWREWIALRWPDTALVAGAAVLLPFLTVFGVNTSLTDGIGLPTPSIVDYLMAQFTAFAFYYLRCFLVPVGLSIEPPFIVSGGPQELLAAAGAALFAATLYLLYRFRDVPPIALGIFLLIAPMVAYGAIVQPELVSDARFYIPLSGLCLICGYGLARMAERSRKNAALTFAFTVLLLCGLSGWRSYSFASDETLFKETLKTNPESARMHAFLAQTYLKQDKPKEARIEALEALKNDAESVSAHLALGQVALREKDLGTARQELEKASELAEAEKVSSITKSEVRAALADLYMQIGMLNKARPLLEEARLLQPRNSRLSLLLGKAYLFEGKPVLALMELNKGYAADRLNPDYFEPLAQALLDSKMPAMAYQAYMMADRAVTVTPSLHSFQLLARASITLGKMDVAEEWIKQSFRKDAHNAETLYLASLLARERGNKEAAKKYLDQARAADPEIAEKVPSLPADQMKRLRDDLSKMMDARSAPAGGKPESPEGEAIPNVDAAPKQDAAPKGQTAPKVKSSQEDRPATKSAVP